MKSLMEIIDDIIERLERAKQNEQHRETENDYMQKEIRITDYTPEQRKRWYEMWRNKKNE